MVMPTFDEIMYPLLKTIEDGNTYKVFEINENIMNTFFNLTEEEKRIKVSNGRDKFFDRLLWARTYLKKAGLVESPDRGYVKITDEGKTVIQSGIKKIDVNFLYNYNSFKEFKETNKRDFEDKNIENNISEELSPNDLIESGYSKLNSNLKHDLIEKLKTMNPYYFEIIVLKLLNKMGYGNKYIETSKSRDGGIDGIINQDELGLDKIYIQCKRFNSNKITELDIRNFIGAMNSVRKGIFVTTSDFGRDAIEKAKDAHNHNIILINGDKLVELMIKFKLGIETKMQYEINEINEDFFIEE